MKATTTLPLHDPTCEARVVGALITDAAVYDRHTDVLRDELFADPVNQAIWQAVRSLREEGMAGDLLCEVPLRLQQLPNAYAAVTERYTGYSVSVDSIGLHIHHLDQLCRRRALHRLGAQMMQQALSPDTQPEQLQDQARSRLDSLHATATATMNDFPTLLRGLRDHADGLVNGTVQRGAPTGFSGLDTLGGLTPGSLTVIGANTSTGKTAFSLSIATHAARNGFPVALYQLEMTDLQVTARLVSAQTGINSRTLLYEPLDGPQLLALDRGLEEMSPLPLYTDACKSASLEHILASIRAMAKQRGVRGAVVDYLQILNLDQRETNKEQAIANAARRLKNLALELGIFVIVLSQLNREGGSVNPEPSFFRLRDSGQIAEAADTVILLYRPELYGRLYTGEFQWVSPKGTCLVDVPKGRNTGTTRFIIGFDAEHTRFYELDRLPRREEKARTADPWE